MSLPKTVYLVSLGCSKNRVDSELILAKLQSAGIAPVSDPREAELILVNTCGFIEPAKEESIDAIFEMARYKQTGACRQLVVTGCLTQRYGAALREEMPEVDAFVGVNEYPRLLEALRLAEDGARPLMTGRCADVLDGPRLQTTPSYTTYIRISDGCDNRCAYCAIPLIRGGYRSRPMDRILAEARALSDAGASEITLIAQDTSRYGSDFPDKTLRLPELLTEIDRMPGVHWLRVLYCYPDTVDERLLDTIATLPKACRYLDLPLQHASDAVLTRMNRRGTKRDIERLILACRARGILVRTTMMVGFPGETDAQFRELLDFVRWAQFGRLGAFTFSPEENTAAAEMDGAVPEPVKRQRLDQLMTLQQGISLSQNEARVGETCEVLVEGRSDGYVVGRSRLEAPEVDGRILFTAQSAPKPGTYCQVCLTRADAYDLFGKEAP